MFFGLKLKQLIEPNFDLGIYLKILFFLEIVSGIF